MWILYKVQLRRGDCWLHSPMNRGWFMFGIVLDAGYNKNHVIITITIMISYDILCAKRREKCIYKITQLACSTYASSNDCVGAGAWDECVYVWDLCFPLLCWSKDKVMPGNVAMSQWWISFEENQEYVRWRVFDKVVWLLQSIQLDSTINSVSLSLISYHQWQ